MESRVKTVRVNAGRCWGEDREHRCPDGDLLLRLQEPRGVVHCVLGQGVGEEGVVHDLRHAGGRKQREE
jgi:hypothetical protein